MSHQLPAGYNSYLLSRKLLSTQFTFLVPTRRHVNTHHRHVSRWPASAYIVAHLTVGRLSTIKLRKWLASHFLHHSLSQWSLWVLNVPFFFPLLEMFLFSLTSGADSSWFTLLYGHIKFILCIRGFSFICPLNRVYDFDLICIFLYAASSLR